MEKKFGPEVTLEAIERFSFLERYEGFCVDLIKRLAKEVRKELKATASWFFQVKFKFKFHMVKTGGYGSFKNGQWTGMIKELRNQQADLSVIDMSMTSIRQSAVDFTIPFMNTGEHSFSRPLCRAVI